MCFIGISWLITNHAYYLYIWPFYRLRFWRAYRRLNKFGDLTLLRADQLDDEALQVSDEMISSTREINLNALQATTTVNLAKPMFSAFNHKTESPVDVTTDLKKPPTHFFSAPRTKTISKKLSYQFDQHPFKFNQSDNPKAILTPHELLPEQEVLRRSTLLMKNLYEPVPVEKLNSKIVLKHQNQNYQPPGLTLLKNHLAPSQISRTEVEEFIREQQQKLVNFFQSRQIEIDVVNVNVGPSTIQFEIKLLDPSQSVKPLLSFIDDIKLHLSSREVRMEAPISGKSTIGIEIENRFRENILFTNLWAKTHDRLTKMEIGVILGQNTLGENILFDLTTTPHLLVAGATGSGKSACLNSLICSILATKTPNQVRLILIDPKKVEFSLYDEIAHLLTPVIIDPKRANLVLKKIVTEMVERFELFTKNKVKNIESYNNKAIVKLAYIVVVIDELADLMAVAGKTVEASIMRITQLARACGIHLVVATQRPSVDVITGIIKANLPSRIAFTVTSAVDSRTILDQAGAEHLLGKGDMLYLPSNSSRPMRVQGCWLEEDNVERIVAYIKENSVLNYDPNFNLDETTINFNQALAQTSSSNNDEIQNDELYPQIVNFVLQEQKASTSLLQRQFKIGYNHAARFIEAMEKNGLVGPQIGTKPREVLKK